MIKLFIPPGDWAIEPLILEPGIMAALTLLSDGPGEPVAHVCNYSSKPYTFKADSFLGLVEPVVHVTTADSKVVGSSLATDSGLSVLRQPDMSTWPESSDMQPNLVPDLMAELCTSTLSTTPTVKDAGPSPKGVYDHVQCLID